MGFIPRINVLLCAPPPTRAIGGGYLYNQAIAAFPSFRYLYLSAPALPAQLPRLLAHYAVTGRRVTHVLLDSLYLASPAELSATHSILQSHRRRNGVMPQLGLLAHLLPSQNLQSCTPADKIRAESVEAMLLRCFAFGVAPSQFTAHELSRLGLPATHVGVAYPAPVVTSSAVTALSTDQGQASQPEPTQPSSPPVRFLSVGNWSPRKNLAELVNIFGAMKQYDWTWQVVVGDSAGEQASGRAEFTRKVNAMGIQDRVALAVQPRPAQLHELYRNADCFILSPIAETYGIVFAEALASGCAVIAPNTPPFTEFLTPQHDSLLCSPQQPDAWVAAATAMVTNNKERSRMQANAPLSQAAQRTYTDTATDLSNFLSGLTGGIAFSEAAPNQALRVRR